MKTRYGSAPWLDQFPSKRRPDYPRLRGEHTTKVVIVGGGLTGCATALACASAGLTPMLIEVNRIGQGATGRSAGLLLPEPGPSFRDVTKAHGLRVAKQVFELWRRGSLDAAAQLRRFSIQCGLEPRDTLLVASRYDDKDLRREYESRQAAGMEGTWLTPKQLKALAALDGPGAIRLRDGFALDPYRACLGLAAAAARRGVSIFERTRVKKIKFTRKDITVVLDDGEIHASTAIVATGSATEEFRSLRRHFKRREAYMALTEPVAAGVRKQASHRSLVLRAPGHRLHWTRDDRLLIAGADQDETPSKRRDAVLVQRTGQLMYEALMMFPAISGLQPEYGWEAPYGQTADGLMYVGSHRNYPHHLFALGDAGQSVTGAFVAAKILARAVRGTPEKGDDILGWTR